MEINKDESVDSWQEEDYESQEISTKNTIAEEKKELEKNNNNIDLEKINDQIYKKNEEMLLMSETKRIYGIQGLKTTKWENLQNYAGRVQIYGKKKNIWTGNPLDRVSQLFTLFLFFIVFFHFYFYVAEWYDLKYGYFWVKWINYPFIIVIVYTLFKCMSTDPGVLPRGDLQDPDEIEGGKSEKSENQKEEQLQQQQQNQDNINNNQSELIQRKQNLNLKMYEYRYCKTCKIMRPPKSSHCGRCDQCVTLYDHHCFFIGNCVGSRNIKYFMTFLIVGVIYGCINFGFTMFSGYIHLKNNDHLLDKIDKHPLAKFFFLWMLFVWCWGQTIGCPRKCYKLIGNMLCISLAILIFKVGGDIYSGEPQQEENEIQQQQLILDGEDSNNNQENLENNINNNENIIVGQVGYIYNPISVMVQFMINMTAMGVLFPMFGTTCFSVSRGITKKEKVHLDDYTNRRFDYQQSTSEILSNFIIFYKSKTPESFHYD